MAVDWGFAATSLKDIYRSQDKSQLKNGTPPFYSLAPTFSTLFLDPSARKPPIFSNEQYNAFITSKLFIPYVRENRAPVWLSLRPYTARPGLYKGHPIVPKPLLSAFGPTSLALMSLRQLLQNLTPLVDQLVASMEENPDDDAPQPVPFDLQRALINAGWGCLREVTTVTLRRFLEHRAVQRLQPRLAWKLTKDVSQSAMMKVKRHSLYYSKPWARVHSSIAMFRTTLRAHILGTTAAFLVQTAIDIFICVRNYRARYSRAQPRGLGEAIPLSKPDAQLLMGRVVKSTARHLGALSGAAVGAAAGTLLWPGFGTSCGLVFGDFAGFYVVSMRLDS